MRADDGTGDGSRGRPHRSERGARLSDVVVTRTPSVARWTAGFGTVFARESRRWWTTWRWWTQALLWAALLHGLLLAFVWIAEQAAATGPAVGVAQVWPQYLPVAVLLSTVGVVVLTQGVMLDERPSGALEWVLTKPVSRTAFVLAKLAARGLPVLFVLVVVPLDRAVAAAVHPGRRRLTGRPVRRRGRPPQRSGHNHDRRARLPPARRNAPAGR